MPFTASHAAAALPFLRTPLIPSAIVVGTVTPDLPYFLPFPTFRGETHSALGIITVDLAIGLVVWLAWIAVLRAPLVDLSPEWIRQRMPRSPALPWHGDARLSRLGLLVAAILLGTITHVLWDAPTHPGWLSQNCGWLGGSIGELRVTSLLQHVSSIGGVLLLAVWARLWTVRTPRQESEGRVRRGIRHRVWIGVAASGVLAGIITLIGGIAGGEPVIDSALTFRIARVGIGVALGVGVAVCAAWHIANRRRQPERTDTGRF